MDFRASNPKIKELWAKLESDCYKCVTTDYKVELPSGRILPYFNVNWKGGLVLQKTLGEPPIKVWGGFLTENVTQATARDVMRDAIIRLEDAGIETLFTVHDEIVAEVDANFP
jgi:DNA polymerase